MPADIPAHNARPAYQLPSTATAPPDSLILFTYVEMQQSPVTSGKIPQEFLRTGICSECR